MRNQNNLYLPRNSSKRKPTIFGSDLLNDPTTEELLAPVEISTLTGIRKDLESTYIADKRDRLSKVAIATEEEARTRS